MVEVAFRLAVTIWPELVIVGCTLEGRPSCAPVAPPTSVKTRSMQAYVRPVR